ncbi:MAG: hypothetical protein HC883_01190 [Bdellovibrionaceae bacterium]|nr:hypothetical protein [Pseudobdellovibrionaceae bacterium]
MEQTDFSDPNRSTKFDSLSREDLIKRQSLLEDENLRLVRENYELRQISLTDEQLRLITAEQLEALNDSLYGASSERWKKPKDKSQDKSPLKPRVKKPSERYPNVPVREVHIKINPIPQCDSCGNQMKDSGMAEESEQLTVIPKKYEIVRNLRTVYTCSCHSCMKTAPLSPRILEGSTYSDEMILDVSLSKYCDLIPIERYAQMASRGGVKDLPANSLIDLTHHLLFL